MRRRRHAAGLAAAVVAASGLAGCGSSVPTPLHAAPEPAKAAVPARQPAGRVIALASGSEPEGAVWDPSSGLVAVGLRKPDRLALLDPAGGSLRTIPVPGSARHLELASPGVVLVPGEDTNQVASVALPTGNVEATVPVLKQPHDVAVVSPTDWYVADEFGPAVSHVFDGRVVATFRGKLQPGGAAAAGGTGAVVDVRQRLLWLYRGGKEVAHLPAGAGPTHAVAIGGSRVVVTDTTGGALLIYDISGHGRKVQSVALPDQPYGTAYDATRHRLWITATGANLLVSYDVTDHGLVQLATYPTVRDAYAVAVDSHSGAVVVVGTSGAQLQLLQP